MTGRGERKRAIEYLRRAGEQAAAQFANAGAVTHFTRAMGLTPEDDPAERFELLLAREGMCNRQGALEARRQDLASLEHVADDIEDHRRRAEVALRQANWAHATADYSAIAAAHRSVRLACTVGDARTEAEPHQRWGDVLWQPGHCIASRTKGEEALALARTAHLPRVEAQCLGTLGMGFTSHRDHADGLACYERWQRTGRVRASMLRERGRRESNDMACRTGRLTEEVDSTRGRTTNDAKSPGGHEGSHMPSVPFGGFRGWESSTPAQTGFADVAGCYVAEIFYHTERGKL